MRGAVVRDQAAERVPAGDQHHAAGATGQQRAYLCGVAGVVEDDEYLPAGQQGPVQRGGPVLGGRYPLGRHAERDQESGERVDRSQRRDRGVPAQVDVELAAREPVPHRVRPLHGERGLAHPGGAAEHGDRDRGQVHAVEQRVQPVQVWRSPGEPGDGGRQLRRHHRCCRRYRWLRRFRADRGGSHLGCLGGQRQLGSGEDRLLQLLERGAGLDAELVDQRSAELPVRLQRLGPPLRLVQRGDQVPPQPFPQRIVPDESGAVRRRGRGDRRAAGRSRCAAPARSAAAPPAGMLPRRMPRCRCHRTPARARATAPPAGARRLASARPGNPAPPAVLRPPPTPRTGPGRARPAGPATGTRAAG